MLNKQNQLVLSMTNIISKRNKYRPDGKVQDAQWCCEFHDDDIFEEVDDQDDDDDFCQDCFEFFQGVEGQPFWIYRAIRTGKVDFADEEFIHAKGDDDKDYPK